MKDGSFRMKAVQSASDKVRRPGLYSALDNRLFNDKTDFKKSERLIIDCANYLLDSPIDYLNDDLDHLNAAQFIFRWMEGTPNYSFGMDESIIRAVNADTSFLGIFMAIMAKYVLENKHAAGNTEEVKYHSLLAFINYIEDPSKNVRLNKDLKALINARDHNMLKEYLNI